MGVNRGNADRRGKLGSRIYAVLPDHRAQERDRCETSGRRETPSCVLGSQEMDWPRAGNITWCPRPRVVRRCLPFTPCVGGGLADILSTSILSGDDNQTHCPVQCHTHACGLREPWVELLWQWGRPLLRRSVRRDGPDQLVGFRVRSI